MATRIKTIHYSMETLTTMTNATLTAMTQRTIYLPEFSGVVTFKKVIAVASFMEGATQVTGNYASRRMDVSVGGAAAVSHNNTNLYTGSGENTCVFFAADCTAHFISNWTSGTSKTLDVSLYIDGTAATTAWRNMNVDIYITYEYDDTQTTQIKTVFIPLNMPVGVLATSKPGTALATIPALDTELPEASKVYRDRYIIVQGNFSNTNNTTDTTVTMQLGTLTAYTTQAIEAGEASDYWLRYIWNLNSLNPATNSSHGWFCYSNAARHNHLQAYMVVTYEFDASQSNDIFVSVMLPQALASPMGGTTSSDYQRGTREFWIQEPGTITTKQIAFYAFWESASRISSLLMRVGTGSFVTYTDIVAALCGSNGSMIRNDSAFTLVRGKNTLQVDFYRTETVDLGMNLCGFWICNYTASKPTQGYGAANRTIFWNLNSYFDGAAAVLRNIAATAPSLSSTDFFINAIGTAYKYTSNSTGNPSGVTVLCEKTVAEGGLEWLPCYIDFAHTDGESGLRHCYSQVRSFFWRWNNDPDPDRLNFETSRRWRCVLNSACATFGYLDLIFTIHNITYTVAGNVTGSGGGTVNLYLHRGDANSEKPGERLKVSSRSGDGAYSFTWYDNTQNVFVSAYEDATHLGTSAPGTAT